MKKFIFLFLSSLFLLSCEDSAVSSGRKLYEMYFEKTLKDPDSFKIYSEKYTKDGEFTVEWELDYGAKNSFGAMVRETIEFTTTPNFILINGKSYKKSELQ